MTKCNVSHNEERSPNCYPCRLINKTQNPARSKNSYFCENVSSWMKWGSERQLSLQHHKIMAGETGSGKLTITLILQQEFYCSVLYQEAKPM